MKTTPFILSTALFVVLSGVSAQAVLTLNTPTNVVVCLPLQITWTGGTAPYFLVRMALITCSVNALTFSCLCPSVEVCTDVNGAALQDFGIQQGNAFSWPKVTYPIGTSLDLSIRDSTGQSSQSAVFTVLTGGDVSCLNGGASAVPSANTAASTAAGSSVAPATSVSSPAASKAASSGSAASASSARPSSTRNAAMATSGVSYGAAGVLGAVVAAVLA
ncbi:hypothetical protein BJV78DRAFT_1283341 [Lactifluus subvellereus]|nr:hypothetical protein BJV78DRAFT_1283341 [Lactifluus subvellereus]